MFERTLILISERKKNPERVILVKFSDMKMKNGLSYFCIAPIISHILHSCKEGYYHKIWSCDKISFPWTEDPQIRELIITKAL